MDNYNFARNIAMNLFESQTKVAVSVMEAVQFAVDGATNFYKDVDKDMLLQDLLQSVNVNISSSNVLKNDEKHVPWLEEEKSKLDWVLWERYRRYLLEEKRWPLKVVQSLDKTTDEVLGLLENPKDTDRSFDRKGLVVGYVQSGKTANFTGLINKAIDAGYKLIVVLAGMHNSLRSQTQMRLDEEVLGYETSKKQLVDQTVDQAVGKRIGVSTMTGEKYINIGFLTSRDDKGDFNKKVAKSILVQPGQQPFLLVVKKNASVLRNLVSYFRNDNPLVQEVDGRKVVKNIPLLLIDDEADQASVNTGDIEDEEGNVMEDYDPTKINKLIRELYVTFDQRAYVGYTATPFANIYVHNTAEHENYGRELFPSSFIISLPKPSNYVGPAEVFGLNRDDDVEQPLIRVVDDASGFAPDKHKSDHTPSKIPDSLKEAIYSFILSTAIRKVRGQVKTHNSMLIHVTRFTAVQKKIYGLVFDFVEVIRREIRYGRNDEASKVREDLKELWAGDYVETTAEMTDGDPLETWELIEEELLSVVESIKVKEINGSTGDILDYKEHKDTGLNVIAVGGDKLSRGLTLDGLTVSYYLRTSKMYDTLMQMGRWFGYRDGYHDLCRIYTTGDLVKWFRHIAIAMEDLREELNEMAATKATPEEFGLRVMAHPVMYVTSQLKMKSGTKMKLSYAGTISETTVFDLDEKVLDSNFYATDRFVTSLGAPDKDYFKNRQRSVSGSHLLWDDVDGQAIVDFLEEFKTHKDCTRANAQYLKEYVQKQYNQGELTSWTVALINVGDSDDKMIGGHTVGRVKRNTLKDENDTRGKGSLVASMKRLVTPDHELFDFTKQQLNAVKKMVEEEGENLSTNRKARKIRSKKKGLLLIYPLDIESKVFKIHDIKQTPIGIALSFPDSDTAESVDYVANNVYMEYENE